MTHAHSPAPEEVMAFLDGELPAADAREIEMHLRTCEGCQRLADDLRGVSREMRAWPIEDAPASLRLPARTRMWPRALAAAAVLALVAGAVAWNVLEREQQGEPAVVVEMAKSNAPSESRQALAMPEARALAQSQSQPRSRAAGPSIVRTVTLRIVTANFEAVRPTIDRTLVDMGGFVGQLGASDAGNAPRSIRGTLRVPAARLTEAVAALRTLGRVLDESQHADDVTEQVVDLDTRISNARITEKRLTELLQQRKGGISEVLQVEREMARVRTELEQLDAQRKHLARRVDYATLNLEVVEERAPDLSLGPVPIPARLRLAVTVGFQWALSSVVEAVVFALRIVPGLLLWAVLIGLPAVALSRRLARNRSRWPFPR